jgi:hypothetical protein
VRLNRLADYCPLMTRGRAARRLLAIALLAAAAACAPTAATKLYTGPTEPLDKVVAHINANASRIPTLWATVKYFEATLVDEQHHSQFVNGNGSLLYRSGGDFRLDALKEGTPIFQIGTNAERYWMKVFPDPTSTMWWGSFANLDKAGVQQLPVRPDLVREVLGLSAIPADLVSPPVPIMRFNNDARVYMIVWSIPKDDQWIPQREIWYDMTTFKPQRVLLFDSAGKGRVVLKADLLNPIPVSGADHPGDPTATVAGRYHLLFPDSGSTLDFELGQAALSHRDSASPASLPAAPNDGNFRFRIDPALNKVVQLDADVHP